MTALALQLEEASKRFDDGTIGLDSVTLRIEVGEFLAVTGPSGSGKSTLLNLLGVLQRADDGSVYIVGHDVQGLTEPQRDAVRGRSIGFVFQSSHMLPDESAASNVSLPLRTHGVATLRQRVLVPRALAAVGLQHRADTAAKHLSGGERQRLAVARALIMRPRIVLADEPTGNLDQSNGRAIMRLLERANATGTTIVIVTHDPDVAGTAQRQVHLLDGHVTTAEIGATAHAQHTGDQPGSSQAEEPSSRPERLRRLWFATIDVLDALSRRLGRALLLCLAFVIGVGGVVTATGVSETAATQIATRLTAAALDEVRVLPSTSSVASAATTEAWERGAMALQHVTAAGMLQVVGAESARVRRTAVSPSTPGILVAAVSSGLFAAVDATIEPANAATLFDESLGPVAVVGASVAETLGIDIAAAGVGIWVRDMFVPVVGIVDGGREQWQDAVLVTASVVEGMGATVSLIARTDVGFPAAVADALPAALDAAHPGQFRVETVADLRDLRLGVASDLTIFLAVLAAVLIVLACAAASATMYLSVQQRTAEIALRRAIGASRKHVAGMFVLEGTIIGAFGGALGAVIGTVVTLVVTALQGWQTTLSPGLAPTAVLLGVLAGAVSAIVPAVAASRKEPSEALRGSV